MISLKRILIPTDFSEFSQAALSYALELAKTFDAQLFHLHVPGTTGENFEADFPIGAFASASALRAALEAESAAGRHHEFAVRIGAPAEEINRYARDRDVDLIVMGTHGRSGISHMLTGSVAELVLRGAGCPVLVIRGR